MNRRDFIKKTAANSAGIMLPSDLLIGKKSLSPAPLSEKIKIGQIGVCHSHAGARMNTLKKMSDIYDIVGVVDDRSSTAARFEEYDMKPFEGANWMTEEELLNTTGLQAILVETSNTDLVPVSLRCMERNLAISMDKPGGDDLKLFGKLLEGCKQKKLPFQIAYMLRNNPAIQFCQKAVREGWLGDVFEIQAAMSHKYRGEAYQRYFGHYKGGNMFILGCHHIDWVVSLLGEPKKVNSFLGSTSGALAGVKNNCWAVLEYPHAIVTIHVSDMEIDGDANRRVKICGSKGTIELNRLERFDGKPLSLELRLGAAAAGYAKGNHTIHFDVQHDRYKAQLLEFAKMVKGEISSAYSFEHDYLTQKIHLTASGYI
jgi:predicted dehydrogenase